MTAPGRLSAAHLPPAPPRSSEVALDALLTLWDALVTMTDDEAQRFLTGPGAAFLLGLDVEAVLDALSRDRARAAARRLFAAREVPR